MPTQYNKLHKLHQGSMSVLFGYFSSPVTLVLIGVWFVEDQRPNTEKTCDT